MLLKITDGVVFGHGDGALIRFLFPRQQPEQGGFAVTVPADQPDPFTWVDAEGGFGKEDLLPVGFGQIDRCDQWYHPQEVNQYFKSIRWGTNSQGVVKIRAVGPIWRGKRRLTAFGSSVIISFDVFFLRANCLSSGSFFDRSSKFKEI